MLKKRHFATINSCISGEVGARFQSKTCTITLDTTTLVYRTGCALLNIEVTVSSITKCLNTSKMYRKVARCHKNCV